MSEKPKYQDKEWLRKQYLIKERKIPEIAKECNITKKTIHYWLRKFKFPKRKPTVGNFDNHPMGENNPNWKGDNVGYHCLHVWVKKNKPKPEECEICGKKEKYLELANLSGEYRRDPNDFKYMCIVCHKKYDGNYEKFLESGKATRLKKGHRNELRWGNRIKDNLRIDDFVESTNQSKPKSIIKTT